MFLNIFKHLLSLYVVLWRERFVLFINAFILRTENKKGKKKKQKRRSQGGAWAIDLLVFKFETTNSQAPLVPPTSLY
jgi:hypothetical protein